MEKLAAARLSVAASATLVGLKLAVGLWTHSVSILSEAVHSASDLMAAWVALVSVRIADAPPDEEHPFGHGKAENLSGLIEALLIFGAAGYIVFEAVQKLRAGHAPEMLGAGMAVMALSMVSNALVSGHLFRVAKKTDSQALAADAEHLRTDAFTSAGVFIGLALVALTGRALFDPLAAIGVALLIMFAAWRIIREATSLLMDTQLPADELAQIVALLDADPNVRGHHRLRTRKSGAHRYMDVHVLLDDDLSLVAAHAIAEALEDNIRAALPHASITIHMEPYEAETQHQREAHRGDEEVRR